MTPALSATTRDRPGGTHGPPGSGEGGRCRTAPRLPRRPPSHGHACGDSGRRTRERHPHGDRRRGGSHRPPPARQALGRSPRHQPSSGGDRLTTDAERGLPTGGPHLRGADMLLAVPVPSLEKAHRCVSQSKPRLDPTHWAPPLPTLQRAASEPIIPYRRRRSQAAQRTSSRGPDAQKTRCHAGTFGPGRLQ